MDPKPRFRLPLWLKIFFVLIAISLFGTLIAVFSESLFLPLFLLIFILFPGRTPERPRMFLVSVWIWALSFAAAIFLIAAKAMHVEIPTLEGKMPTDFELWSSLILFPPFLWAYLKRSRYFLPILVGSSSLFIGTDVFSYVTGPRDLHAAFDLIGNTLGELMMTGYFVWRFRTPDSADPASL